MKDSELLRVAEEFRDGILDGQSSYLMCHVVSYPLQGFLQMLGVKSEVTVGDIGFANHVWLTLDDGRILDPTIDQYSQYEWCPKVKVYLGKELPFYQAILDEDDPIWTGATWHERMELLSD